ncbi:MAG: alanine racemase, partial [Pseudomonadota bacterium]|nr:alanine racemase [Pseudomonadota bacterium]
MPRPLIAHIDLQALQHNVSRVRAYAPHSKIMAVIKANAYGHGMLRVAKVLPVDGLAILTLEEALCLRGEGFNCPILMLEGVFSPDEWNILASQRISSVIHNQEQLHWLEKARMVLPVDIFLKVNTGMNRLGFNPHEIGLVYARLQACKHARLVTLMTHFAQADEERGVEEQLHVFEQVTYGLGCLESMANSAAIIRYPQSHKDWVRPGVMLYGASPFSGVNACSFDLRPVMTLESVLIAIQNLRK